MLADSDTYGSAEQQLLNQVLKVVSVWKSHKFYPKSDLNELRDKLASIQELTLSTRSSKTRQKGAQTTNM